MSQANGLIHAGADDATVHKVLCALREGHVPDLDPERHHDLHPGPKKRWIVSGMNPGGLLTRRIDEQD